MDGGAWWAIVHGVAKSRTQLSNSHTHTHTHTHTQRERNEFQIRAAIRMNLKDTVLSEIIQTQRTNLGRVHLDETSQRQKQDGL